MLKDVVELLHMRKVGRAREGVDQPFRVEGFRLPNPINRANHVFPIRLAIARLGINVQMPLIEAQIQVRESKIDSVVLGQLNARRSQNMCLWWKVKARNTVTLCKHNSVKTSRHDSFAGKDFVNPLLQCFCRDRCDGIEEFYRAAQSLGDDEPAV